MILLIGGKGAIGRRYASILRHYKVPFQVFDNPTAQPPEIMNLKFDKAIICTPTVTHYFYCIVLLNMAKPFLCEKPLSKYVLDCETLSLHENEALGSMVNNWSYVLKPYLSDYHDYTTISYDYFHTGSDGLVWDVCQLVHISKKENLVLRVNRTSDLFQVELQDKHRKNTNILLTDIHLSYRHMIHDFVFDPRSFEENRWSLKEGFEMTTECLMSGVQDDEDTFSNPSQKQLHQAS